MTLLRTGLTVCAALALGATPPPAPAAGGSGDSIAGPAPLRANWRTITFRGAFVKAPPGVVPLGPNTFLFGAVEVELPEDVVLSFNDQGEALFTLADDENPHAFVVRVGESRIVVGARSRLVVPPPAVGKPRFEAASTYRVPTAREYLDESYDLGDPFDASPYR
jgi:hypothetical protein